MFTVFMAHRRKNYLIVSYIKHLGSLKKMGRFEENLIRHCSPTLAGMKTGCMFVYKYSRENELMSLLGDYNVRLSGRGVRMTILRANGRSALIYVYRPDYLKKDLKNGMAVNILSESGYSRQDPGFCLTELCRRLRDDEGFPHEIGLFLGYPPSDVRGFMNSPSEGVKCVGCWKVYGNQKEAEKTFAKYKKCKAAYLRAVKKGKPLEYLIVDNRSNRCSRVVNI